jgi:hypothetical protein
VEEVRREGRKGEGWLVGKGGGKRIVAAGRKGGARRREAAAALAAASRLLRVVERRDAEDAPGILFWVAVGN